MSIISFVYWIWGLLFNIKLNSTLIVSAYIFLIILQTSEVRLRINLIITFIQFSFSFYVISNHFLFFFIAAFGTENRALFIITGVIPTVFILLSLLGMVAISIIEASYKNRYTFVLIAFLIITSIVILILSIFFFLDFGFNYNQYSKDLSDFGVFIILLIGSIFTALFSIGCLYKPLRSKMFLNKSKFMFLNQNYNYFGIAMILLLVSGITEIESIEKTLKNDFLLIIMSIGSILFIISQILIFISINRIRIQVKENNMDILKKRNQELEFLKNTLTQRVEIATHDLQKEKNKIELVVDIMSNGFLVISPDGSLLLTNQAFRNLFIRILQIEFPKDFNLFNLPKNKLITSIIDLHNNSNDIRDPITIGPIEDLFLNLQIHKLYSPFENVNPIGSVIEIRDVTKFKKYDIISKNFISTVSHELRTPITAIDLSMKNLIKYQKNLSDEQKEEIIDGINQSTSLLISLVEDLLLISKIEEGGFKIEKTNFNYKDALQKVLKQIEPIRKNKDIVITTSIPSVSPLYADWKRINQVQRILLDNAIKYSTRGSEIVISVKNEYFGRFNPTFAKGTLIQFSDNGVGISNDDLPYIFTRFFRANNVKGKTKGTGLGLAIAKDIINLHKGEIYIESELGKGSILSIFIPQ